MASASSSADPLQRTAMHCNTLPYAATHSGGDAAVAAVVALATSASPSVSASVSAIGGEHHYCDTNASVRASGTRARSPRPIIPPPTTPLPPPMSAARRVYGAFAATAATAVAAAATTAATATAATATAATTVATATAATVAATAATVAATAATVAAATTTPAAALASTFAGSVVGMRLPGPPPPFHPPQSKYSGNGSTWSAQDCAHWCDRCKG